MMTEQTVVLPRTVVEALVDPQDRIYAISRDKPGYDEYGYEIYESECRYCGVKLEVIVGTSTQDVPNPLHGINCPVRVTQEVLAGTRSFCVHCGSDTTNRWCHCENGE